MPLTKLPTALGAARPSVSLGGTTAPALQQLHRSLHQTSSTGRPPPNGDGAMPDALGKGSFKGRTAGGEPLDSSSDNAPPQPKISNMSVPGKDGSDKLTKEQKEEVDTHNKEFAEKHDTAEPAADDKVDKKFWK